MAFFSGVERLCLLVVVSLNPVGVFPPDMGRLCALFGGSIFSVGVLFQGWTMCPLVKYTSTVHFIPLKEYRRVHYNAMPCHRTGNDREGQITHAGNPGSLQETLK